MADLRNGLTVQPVARCLLYPSTAIEHLVITRTKSASVYRIKGYISAPLVVS